MKSSYRREYWKRKKLLYRTTTRKFIKFSNSTSGHEFWITMKDSHLYYIWINENSRKYRAWSRKKISEKSLLLRVIDFLRVIKIYSFSVGSSALRKVIKKVPNPSFARKTTVFLIYLRHERTRVYNKCIWYYTNCRSSLSSSIFCIISH